MNVPFWKRTLILDKNVNKVFYQVLFCYYGNYIIVRLVFGYCLHKYKWEIWKFFFITLIYPFAEYTNLCRLILERYFFQSRIKEQQNVFYSTYFEPISTLFQGFLDYSISAAYLKVF